MHPAYSVIFFTTASGAGYGLLALIGIFNAGGYLPADRWFGLTGFILALGLITFGLLSSTFHLGHPERAWRAFSQWRTSWLSREGVLAVLNYIPAGLFAIGWVFLEQTTGFWMVMGILAALGAAITVYCTSMIYASLKAIPAWTHALVSPLYLVLGLATGGLILDAMLRVYGAPINGMSVLCLLALVVALALKLKYWQAIDNAPQETDLASATGLGDIGTVRVLDKPHTSENYIQQEMGFKVARKHGKKLRRIAATLLFILPTILVAVTLVAPSLAIAAAVLAVIAAAIGIVTERWLFFAEAKHVVITYYEG
jgi:sulfite dehydrogenase (quinone) subunit SoeC